MRNKGPVRAKKNLGQHFLRDQGLAGRIAGMLDERKDVPVLEIGPGTGILTRPLLERFGSVTAIELDTESVHYLEEEFKGQPLTVVAGDFLSVNWLHHFRGNFRIAGNFPYQISTQILFRLLEYREQVTELVGMFQKEVAERVVSGPGNRDYGILSVLLQPWFSMELMMELNEDDFDPPPRVKSAVIRLRRNSRSQLGCNEDDFRRLVKTAFNQRRKTLRNALRPLFPSGSTFPYMDLRAEALSWENFVELCLLAKFESNTSVNAGRGE